MNRAHTEQRDEVMWHMLNFSPRGERIYIKLTARVTVGVKHLSMVIGGARRYERRLANRKAAA
jgi:hypothetical protein